MSSAVEIGGQRDRSVVGEPGELAEYPCAVAAPRPLSLWSNFSWTFAGNAVYAGCQWGMLIVLAKLGSPEVVGRFAYALAVTGPLVLFANLQLGVVLATDTARRYRFGDYFGLRLATTGLAAVAIVAISRWGGHDRETVLVILAVGAAKTFEAISDIIYGLLQQCERMDRAGRLQAGKGLLSLAAAGLVMRWTGSLPHTALALAATWALRLFTSDLPAAAWVTAGAGRDELRPRWCPGTMATLARVALPVGLVTTLNALEASIPRYYLEHDAGSRELGVFAALSYLVVSGGVVTNALSQAAIPRMAGHHARGELRAFRRLLARLIAVGAALGGAGLLLAAVAGRAILGVVYTPEYTPYEGCFLILVISFCVKLAITFLGTALRAMRRFHHQFWIHAASTSILFILCAWWVPGGGIMGASWAVLGSTVFQAAAYAATVARCIRHPLPSSRISGYEP